MPTTSNTLTASRPAPPTPDAPRAAGKWRSRIMERSKLYLVLYLLMFPTILSMIVFSYYPKADVIIKAFYNWTPEEVQEYIGVKNFLDAASDPIFWQSFKVVAIMLVANLFKMIPGIVVAIAMHRLISNRWRYIYQVLFVIPMVIPSLVWLLIWKSFYDPDFGLLNNVLNKSGVMRVMAWLDGMKIQHKAIVTVAVSPGGEPVTQTAQVVHYTGIMPHIAEFLHPVIHGWYQINETGQQILYQTQAGDKIVSAPHLLFPGIAQIFGSVWGMILLGSMVLTFMYSSVEKSRRWTGLALILAFTLLCLVPSLFVGALGALVGLTLWATLLVAGLFVMSRVLGTSWIIWPFWVMFGVWALWGGAPLLHLPLPENLGPVSEWNHSGFSMLRLPLLIIAAAVITEFCKQHFDRITSPNVIRWIGMSLIAVGSLLVAFGMIWTVPVGQFTEGTPAWLGNQSLVLPALIFWGFPWVGVVGVLIYLAGLQQISQDVYEAAELDGVTPLGKAFRIELPLIMTQVRINLIFMTIGTLTGYEFFLILLGPSGGPGNVGVVPGLYMYNKAFTDGKFGYACALGMVMFFMILLLTIIYQRYVKVDK
ncbi:MAG: carbohydrate ABC transporter permease [Phycisphaerales bacterium]